MNLRTSLVLSLLFTLCFVSISSAQEELPRDNGIFSYHVSPDYRESESHPLRTLAYAIHPIGWMLREGIYRPMSAGISSNRVTRSLFGYRDPFDFRDSVCFDSNAEIPNCRELPPFGQTFEDFMAQASEMKNDKSGAMVQQVYFPDVAFRFDHSQLTTLGKGRVRQIAQLLTVDPEINVVIEGHTDPAGSENYNQKLSLGRSQRVIDELIELGIDPARLRLIGFGEQQVLFSEDEDWANAVNRRVHIVLDSAPQITAAE